jgi:hypothetical protein
LIAQEEDLALRQRREKHAQPVHALQSGVCLERTTDERVPFEERIAPAEQRRQVLQVQGLKIAAHVHHHIALAVA